MAELVGMKIKIKLVGTLDGPRNLYPQFNRLPAAVRNNMDWSAFVDVFGIGWHYDQVAPFGITDDESPNHNEMFGLLAIPEDFANAAAAMFPDEVSLLTDTEFTRLFDTRTKVRVAANTIDTDRLNELRAQYGITGPIDSPAALALMSPEDRKAVDPDDPTPGIVRNPGKTAATLLAAKQHSLRKNPNSGPPPGVGRP